MAALEEDQAVAAAKSAAKKAQPSAAKPKVRRAARAQRALPTRLLLLSANPCQTKPSPGTIQH